MRLRVMLRPIALSFLICILAPLAALGSPYSAGRTALGPIELSSADGTHKVRLQLALQLRASFESRDRATTGGRLERTCIEARRVRLVLSGTTAKPGISYRLHLSTAPGSLELIDLYFGYDFKQDVEFRFGQFKVPFTRYRIHSFQRLTFTDWAIVTRYFGAERQMGFAVHNGYEKPSRLSYVAALCTGQNARASHAVGLQQIYNEMLPNPSDLAESGPKAEFHPELFVHVAYNANGIKIDSDSDHERGGLRYMAALSVAWDLDPGKRGDLEGRVAPELLVKYRGWSFSGVGYAGYGRVTSSTSTNMLLLGGLVQAAWRIAAYYEISARYGIIDFSDRLTRDAAGIRLIPVDQLMQREQEVTIGFNAYLAGHTLKWQHDATWQRQSSDLESRDGFVVRSQFQLAF